LSATESVGRQELDQFIEAMHSIAREAVDDPELVLNAPHSDAHRRLDEAAAHASQCSAGNQSQSRRGLTIKVSDK